MKFFQNAIDSFNVAFFEKGRYLSYLKGFQTTLIISLFSVLVGVAIGLFIAIVKYTAAHKLRKGFILTFLEVICNGYIAIIRGTPVYVQLLILYFIVFTSRNAPPLLAAILCFGINSSAYVAEIIRAGIEAVDIGQTEAGRSLGLSSTKTMIYIILPQAVKNILPALGNEFIVLIKETAIVGAASVRDVTMAAQNVGGVTYDLFTPLLITAAMYFIVVVILTKIMTALERRMAQSDRR